MQRLAFATLIGTFSLIWSSAFIAGAVALEDFDPFTLLALRFAFGSLVLLPFVWVGGDGLSEPRVVRYGLILGLLNNTVYLGLSFLALTMIRPELVIVIISCAPFATTLIAAQAGLEQLSPKHVTGIFFGFAGVLVITKIDSSQPPSIFGLILAMTSMLAFSAGTIIFRRKAAELPILQTNFWQAIAGVASIFPLAMIFGNPLHVPSTPAILALLYLIFVVTTGGMAIWLALIRTSGATTASSYHLLNPLFGLLLSHFLLGGELHATDFFGAILIGTGLFLTLTPVNAK